MFYAGRVLGSSEVPNVNDERQKAASDLTDLLKTLKKGVNQDVTQQLKRYAGSMSSLLLLDSNTVA